MEEQEQTAGRLGNLSVLACESPQARGARRERFRSKGLRQRSLHPQNRGSSPGGTVRTQAFSQPHYVPCPDVLGQRRQQRWRRCRRQWRRPNGYLGCCLLFVALLILSGCTRASESSLEARYAEARLKFYQGYTDAALQLAESGYQESQGLDPVLSWK